MNIKKIAVGFGMFFVSFVAADTLYQTKFMRPLRGLVQTLLGKV